MRGFVDELSVGSSILLALERREYSRGDRARRIAAGGRSINPRHHHFRKKGCGSGLRGRARNRLDAFDETTQRKALADPAPADQPERYRRLRPRRKAQLRERTYRVPDAEEIRAFPAVRQKDDVSRRAPAGPRPDAAFSGSRVIAVLPFVCDGAPLRLPSRSVKALA